MRNFSNLTALLNLIGLSTIGQEFSRTLTSIAVNTSLEHPVNTILYISYGNKTAVDSTEVLEASHLLRTLTTQLALPMLHLDRSPPIERYIRKFNTELLTIAQLNHHLKFDLELLKTMWQRLWRNRQSHLILLFDGSASVEYIELILKVCAKHRALNVIALQPLMAVVGRSYWTLRLFPTQKVIKRTFAADCKNIFPNHMENMYGHPIRIIINSWHPQIYTYTPQKGNATLSGFLGRALTEYAYRHNATIECPISLDHKMFTYDDMIGFFVNKTIDIGSLTPMESGDRDLSFSVFFQWSNWCLMVPVEQPLSRSKFFYNIAHKTVKVLFCLSLVLISCIWALIARWQVKLELSLIDHVVNLSVLLGLLGMPFWTAKRASGVHKMICITISLAGVIISTTYNTYLQSFSVNAPASNRITNIDDLLNSGIKVALRHEELCWVEDSIDFRKYIQNLTIFTNLTEFLLLRDSLDTRYAFPISDIWTIYDQQQKYYSRPLFRISNICFGKNYLTVLPLQESSVHRKHLNEFVASVQEAGLIEHWRRNSFLELLEMNWIRLDDHNKQHGFEPMRLWDLRIILVAMSALMTLSISCFVFEILWMKVQKLPAPVMEIMHRMTKIKI